MSAGCVRLFQMYAGFSMPLARRVVGSFTLAKGTDRTFPICLQSRHGAQLLVRGEPGHAIIPELEPLASEPVIDKPGFGAFYATDLEQLLRVAGVRTLIMAGVTTDICVHSTLREAVDRGFECITAGDACAAGDAAIHGAMLACIEGEGGILGRVATTHAIVTALRETLL
jgi:biuret amidohydrolase